MSERQPNQSIILGPNGLPLDYEPPVQQLHVVQDVGSPVRNSEYSLPDVRTNFADNAVNPNNILSLKEQLDRRVEREKSEATLAGSVRRQPDVEGTKQGIIDRYLQTGADPKRPRKVPADLRKEVSNLMDMSYDQLQELADKQVVRREAHKPVIKTVPEASAEPVPVEPAPVLEPTTPEPVPAGEDDTDRALRRNLASALNQRDPETRQQMLDAMRDVIGDERADALGVPPRVAPAAPPVPPQPPQGGGRGEPPEPPRPEQQQPVYEASAESKQSLANLEAARDQLSILVGQRRARMFNFLRFRENREIRELRRNYEDALYEYNNNFRRELEKANVPAEDVSTYSWQEVTNETYRLGMSMGAAEYAAQESAAEDANTGRFSRIRRALRRFLGAPNDLADPDAIIQRAEALPRMYEANRAQNRIYPTTTEAQQTDSVVRANRLRSGLRAGGAVLGMAGVATLGLIGDQQVTHHVASNAHHVQSVGNALQHAASGGSYDNLPAAAPTPTPLDIRPDDWQWNVAQRMVAPGVNPEAALHQAFNAALANGHTGFVGHNPNGTEYFSLDGTDNVRSTMNVLRNYPPFAS